MILDANAQSFIQTDILPKAVDTLNSGNALTQFLLNNTKTWSGRLLERPIIIGSAGNGGSFSGLDKFSTNTTDTKVKASFDPRGYEQPVVLPQMEIDIARASDSSIEIVAASIEEAVNEMADNLGDLFYGDGTGNTSKDFLGLAAAVDDGGEVATYGGISRSTYTTWKSYEADQGGALTLAAMANAFDAATHGSDRPTVILTTEAIRSAYETLLTPTLRHTDGLKTVLPNGKISMDGTMAGHSGDLGFTGTFYRGVPIIADEKATAGTMYFLNLKHLAFYRLKSTAEGYTNVKLGGNTQIDGVYSDQFASSAAGFDWSGFMMPEDQYASVGHLILMGNLVTFNPNRHAVINTIS